MKSKKSCKYFDACGSAENCARCTGYEKRIPEGTLEQGDEMGRKVKKGDMLDTKPELMDSGLYAIAILSDVQEILNANPEMARQWINKAKYFIGLSRRPKA